MKRNFFFILTMLVILGVLLAAYLFGIERKAQAAVFVPVSGPYQSPIYANGIVESDPAGVANITIYPAVSGPVTAVLVHEGQRVTAGTALISIDNSVHKAGVEQLRLQAEAAQALLQQLQAVPRKQTYLIARSQVALAQSNLNTTQDQYDKRHVSDQEDAQSTGEDAVDTADDAVRKAAMALKVARKQYALTQAGSWSYDIVNQRMQYDTLQKAYIAALTLSSQYIVRAQAEGVVLMLNAAVGSYASSQGAYDSYTQSLDPLIIMRVPQDSMAVRCYMDAKLIERLSAREHMQAQMSIRGSEVKMPLEFVRLESLDSPKMASSNPRQEKVDLRVLPVLFHFKMKKPAMVHPGQQVDVFIGQE